jgi:hypothetical protein
MKLAQPNIISLNEWVDHFDHFIIPIQPGEFEITPILRARYGNLLRDSVVSVRLFAEHHTVILIITEAENTAQVIVDFANTRIDRQAGIGLDDLFFRDTPNAPGRDAPQEERRAWFNSMLSSLLWLFDSTETARYLPVFTPHYLALLERIQLNHNADQDLFYTENRLENTLTFYKDCVETLATPIQKNAKISLISTLANKMKKQEATGVLDGNMKTYWDEVGVIASQGSDNTLYEELCTEIHSDVYYAIKSLSEAEQFALWFFGEADGDLARWFADDFEGVTMEGIKKDFSMIAADIRDELLGMAMNSLSPEASEYLGY